MEILSTDKRDLMCSPNVVPSVGTTSLCLISVAQRQNPATMRAGRLSRQAPQPPKQTYVRCYGLTIVREIILYSKLSFTNKLYTIQFTKIKLCFLLNVNIIKYHIYIISSIAIELIILTSKVRVTVFRYNLSWNI